jgi:hypothetical protein
VERDVLRKQAEQQKTTPAVESEDKPFDLRTAGPIELQQVIGNRATTNLLKGGGSGPVVQTKMTVTDSNDAHEKEADAVAEQIVSGGQSSVQRAGEEELAMKRIQREDEGVEDEIQEKRIQRYAVTAASHPNEAEADEDEIQEKRIQRAADDASMSDDDIATQRIQRDEGVEEEIEEKRIERKETDMSKSFDVGGQIEDQIRGTSGGQKLDAGIQTKMESGTGHDFSNVRVHTDSKADALSNSLGARAFTTGTDIFFKQGEYNPGSDAGQKLIAHEGTHVIQQGGTQLKREDD